MWHVDIQKIYTFQGAGGDRFVEFCDSLIYLETRFLGIPLSAIDTTIKTTVGDGGVDTKIDSGSLNDSTGWFQDKSVWQYKAMVRANLSDKDLKKEINNSFVRDRIQEGCAYRLCVCNSLTAKKIAQWEKLLNAEAKVINVTAPEVKVITADDLSRWVSRYPSLVLRFFQRDLNGQLLDLKTHLANARSITPVYVENPSWAHIQDEIKTHVDFSIVPSDPVCIIQGKSGVGKTRMVSEVLGSDLRIEKLVLYSNDDASLMTILRNLISTPDLRAIIIADNCTLDTRVKISDIIGGYADRIRIIVIENQTERLYGDKALLVLDKMTDDLVVQILIQNFPLISEDQCRLYAELSQGLVRLALDLARLNEQIMMKGKILVTTQISSYYKSCLSSLNERKVVESLSLFLNVGFKDDVREQLDFLCLFSGISRADFESTANRLHDTLGFVGRGGRFYYITPYLVVQVAFEFAWNNWIQNDPVAFFKKLPPTMVRSFVKRVSDCGRADDRDNVRKFFLKWVNNVSISSLAERSQAKKFESIIETNPTIMLPILRKKFEVASSEDLYGISSDQSRGRAGTQHIFVRLLTKFAILKECFFDCELCLFRLAMHETELKIANNATETWKELFRIFLSGTEVPFLDRFNLLRKRLRSKDYSEVNLALAALRNVFDTRVTKRLGPPIVAGSISPRSWHPRTKVEFRDCFSMALDLLVEISQTETFREKALEIGIHHCRRFLHYKKIEQLKRIFSGTLPEELRIQLDDAIYDFIQFDSKDAIWTNNKSYVEEIFLWRDSIRPNDFHGRLFDLLGKNPRNLEKGHWKKELGQFAEEFIRNLKIFSNEIVWLSSEKSKRSGFLGVAIGRRDSEASLLLEIFSAGSNNGNSELAQGYVAGLLEINLNQLDLINKHLDSLMGSFPNFACDIAIVGGKKLRALDRTIELIRLGKVDVQFFKSIIYGAHSTELNSNDIELILRECIRCGKQGDKNSFVTGYRLLSIRLQPMESSDYKILDVEEKVKPAVWDFLEATTKFEQSCAHVGHRWKKIIMVEFSSNPKGAIHICFNALASDNYSLRDEAIKVLTIFSSKYGSLILDNFTSTMLSEKIDGSFYILNLKGVFSQIPAIDFKNWFEQYGTTAARIVARHLPSPFLMENEVVKVPGITQYVFEKFEDDEEVFKAFCEGRQNVELRGGDITSSYEKEAELAKKFFSHPLKFVRDWARYEYKIGKDSADIWRQDDEEMEFELR